MYITFGWTELNIIYDSINSRIQVGLVPLQLAEVPDRTQFLVAEPPAESRYPGEQEKVQWDPAAFRELVQEMLPCRDAEREGEQVATRIEDE